ncbi:MAG: hypothetical protein KBA64_06395 [Armatimonadetes bacterium]|nr:hypothetical protein [Armatimonadota bacterium]MDI9603575.1 hypothetical protein [Acidobacteriota bacterium]NLN90980.1 hypothetical protein [candidate division WS1 bacterium]
MDLAFIHRVYRETAWFAPLIALCLHWRGYSWTVWGGFIGGAALAVLTFYAIERLVMVATEPGHADRLTWIKMMNLLLLPFLGVVLYLYILVLRLNTVAIAGGVTLPMAVGLLKAAGQSWGRWATDGRRSEESPVLPDSPSEHRER